MAVAVCLAHCCHASVDGGSWQSKSSIQTRWRWVQDVLQQRHRLTIVLATVTRAGGFVESQKLRSQRYCSCEASTSSMCVISHHLSPGLLEKTASERVIGRRFQKTLMIQSNRARLTIIRSGPFDGSRRRASKEPRRSLVLQISVIGAVEKGLGGTGKPDGRRITSQGHHCKGYLGNEQKTSSKRGARGGKLGPAQPEAVSALRFLPHAGQSRAGPCHPQRSASN